jgi:hypothetical protein
VSEQPYRAPVPVPLDPYAASWADLKRRRLWVVGGVVWLVVAVLMSSRPKGHPSLTTVVMTFALIALSMWAERFRCPRCAERFCRKGWFFHNGFTRHCLHCGLKVGTLKSDEPYG